jgi:hypothetical protein
MTNWQARLRAAGYTGELELGSMVKACGADTTPFASDPKPAFCVFEHQQYGCWVALPLEYQFHAGSGRYISQLAPIGDADNLRSKSAEEAVANLWIKLYGAKK